MSTFGTIKTSVYYKIARDDDEAEAKAFVEDGINAAQLLAALVFKPPEMQKSGNVTVSAGGSSVSLSALTTLHTIYTVYNNASSKPVVFIPYDRWNFILPLTAPTTAYVEYASRWSNTLYVSPAPTADNILTLNYFALPAVMDDDADELEIVNHDPWIIAIATSYAFACMEEKEAADIWATIGQAHGVPLGLGTQARTEFEEALKHGYYIPRTRTQSNAGVS